MNFSAFFIDRPVATTLLTLGVALAGFLGFALLPVSPLPQVDFPTISVSASLPGASPETMAATVATPLERALGRIAGITEMTSSSSLGNTRITVQFDLSRDIDGAARDVQAALNAARSLLPTSLPSNPTYRKVNPADAPIMILTLTSATMTQGQLYDVASTILAQKLSQVRGIGQVNVGGSSLPAVRVELDPVALTHAGVSLEDVRTAIVTTNTNRPKGLVENNVRHWQIQANDQARTAKEYMPLIVSWQNGAPVRLGDVANVIDSVQDVRNAGIVNGQPSVVLILSRQPGANIIATVDRVKDLLPQLRASIPAAVDLNVALDRTTTIRASLRDVELTLTISIALVILVVFLFLRNGRATLIPSVAVPVSLVGTFGVMYLAGFSLNNLSLMALTIATGFVVDDAIVVLENISRHLEAGMTPREAALRGAREVGFTVLSISLSLIAVFIPIMAMGGIVGRLFREFAFTLSVAILVSLVVSLTTTPAMCARLLKARRQGGQGDVDGPEGKRAEGRISRAVGRFLERLAAGYGRTLAVALRHPRSVMLILLATIGLNVWLYIIVPKGFFPQQDTGRMTGFVQADQAISFQAMRQKMVALVDIVQRDPAVDTVTAYTGGGQRNSGFMFVGLKPRSERKESADAVINRLRDKTAIIPGAQLFLQSVQDIRVGGRQANAQYQYTLQADDLAALREWEPKIRAALAQLPELQDVNTDQQEGGLQTTLEIDRDTAYRLGLNASQVDSILNDAFGQRQVSTIYNPLNQYRVVMELAPRYLQSPDSLRNIYLIAAGGLAVPLAAIAKWAPDKTPLAVNHQGQFVATTISFNLAAKVSLSEATQAIADAMARIGVPTSVQGSFQGTAKVFQQSLASQPILILTALIAVYIVLGILYESLIHPITILSTLPSAGVGALLALMLFNTEFSIIALIAVLLLIGIVKKNAIMMIDFALVAEREQKLSSYDAIYRAAVLRFRPIMMTTMAALFGAVPLAIGHGEGSEMRQPLGIAIVGGLLISQLLTLYTTPVVYLYLDRLRLWNERRRAAVRHPEPQPNAVP
ncbi:multidrug efflux RND transporter permease subunit [Azonexus sp.]|jgi:multidrug efflux pump|uniref:multidrug efflux RND transporter permease subunit n=1 Tax=Azonexus sp. TaxID=1872668 RepID=UPI0028225262|nr:multidrug efflux RND transporter permease subunit [Azonexus sp.]MDR1994193.1 multidrug efflux RND transporter permease subunit [Azonexus sp.]